MKLSLKSLHVLNYFLKNIGKERSGADITSAIKIGSGTLYPLLMRFETQGWLESRWEDQDPSEIGRPRRRYYRLTGLGQRMAIRELEALQTNFSDGAVVHPAAALRS